MISWMKYPGGNAAQVGEQVTYAYYNQGAVKNIYSNTNSYYYLEQASYDAAGRLELADLGAANLGSNPLLKNDPSYYAWNQSNMSGRPDHHHIRRLSCSG